jgi:protein-tyrosine phosphatase
MQYIPFERSYWVLPNKLLAGEVPTHLTPEQTYAKLDALVAIGVDVVINLMEADEMNAQGISFFDYSDYLNQFNVTMYRMPIVDLSVPTVETMRQILQLIDANLKADKTVYFHCWGGVGRTGTVLGCYLKQFGYASNQNVFELIRYLKRTTSINERDSPETHEQREFVLNWAQ